MNGTFILTKTEVSNILGSLIREANDLTDEITSLESKLLVLKARYEEILCIRNNLADQFDLQGGYQLPTEDGDS